MRILVCGINYAPEMISTGKYTAEMASWLAAAGHQVRVVTAPPYYPAWRVNEGYSGRRYSREILCGVRVTRCPLWVPGRPTGATRILHLASFAASSAPILLRDALSWRPHLVWLAAPTLLCAPAVLAAARVAGARSWLHVQDFEIDMAFGLGILRRHAARRFVERVERSLMGRFDRVSTISGRMLHRLAEKGVEEAHRFLFPNWVDTTAIFPLDGPSPLRGELDVPPGATVALYSGIMGEKQGLDVLIDAARRLSGTPNLLFVLCGEGPARERLVRLAGDLGNLRFLPLQPTERLNDLLSLADVHLLPQRSGAADLVMPSKLTGMLASGRPVVATAAPGTEIAAVLREAGGTVTAPGDAEALSRAVLELASDGRERAARGRAARQWAEAHLSARAILSRFEAEVRAVVR